MVMSRFSVPSAEERGVRDYLSRNMIPFETGYGEGARTIFEVDKSDFEDIKADLFDRRYRIRVESKDAEMKRYVSTYVEAKSDYEKTYEKRIRAELESSWEGMDTKKGRWFSDKVPKKVVKAAREKVLKSVASETKAKMDKAYASYMKKNPEADLDEFWDSEKVWEIYSKIHGKIFRQVDWDYDWGDPEWHKKRQAKRPKNVLD